MDKQYDSEEIYCRKLGHHLTFKYCRSERQGNPCLKIHDCWFHRIPIEDYLKTCCTEDEIAALFSPPPSKVSTLVELIEKAKKRGQEKG